MMTAINIYQTAEIRELEKRAIEQNISGDELMLRAANAAFNYMLQRFSRTKSIAVFCGTGNNGGDGYVLARLAHEHGLDVQVYQVGDHENLKNEAKNAFLNCQEKHVRMQAFHESIELKNIDLIIDAICGIGVRDILRDSVLTAVKKIQVCDIPIFSLDVPTGIDADTGNILGTALQATATITFMGLKLGLLTGNGIAYTGDLICDELQLSKEILASVVPVAEKISLENFAQFLQPRLRDWHKGLSGHVLIVGGDKGYSGAAVMAAEAALRVGAGLVSVATHPENAVVMNVSCPEIMCHAAMTVEQLKPLVTKADVIVLGPGLGQSDWAKTLWEEVTQQKIPLVIDADGLNILAAHHKQHKNWVLTPHPGEAARLLNTTTQAIQTNRLSALRALQERYHSICVLKGAGSLVLAPPTLPAVCDRGNPGMSSAGMGDILSGVIAGLIAQRIPLGDAAKLGVYLHAAAGDLAAKAGERGTIATDLLPYLRQLVNL